MRLLKFYQNYIETSATETRISKQTTNKINRIITKEATINVLLNNNCTLNTYKLDSTSLDANKILASQENNGLRNENRLQLKNIHVRILTNNKQSD